MRGRRSTLAPLAAALLLGGTAEAGVFQRKTMHQTWPERQIERDLVLPKGWFQAELALDHKYSRWYRDDIGALQTWRRDATWRYSRMWLSLEQGFSRRTTLYVRVPFVWAHLSNDLGASTGTFALGDVHAGLVLQPWVEREWGAALRLDYKTQSGVEWPANFSGGPDNVEGFLTGTGISNLGAHLQGFYRVGDLLRFDLEAGYVFKVPGIVGYVVEVAGFGNGWIDPGDEVRVAATATIQVMDGLAVSVDPTLSWRGWYRVGVSGFGHKLDPAEFWYPKDAGAYFDLQLRADLDPSPTWGVTLHAGGQLIGTETLVFSQLGLDEFTPQPGVVVGAKGRVRW